MKHAALGAVVLSGLAGVATAGEIDATLQQVLDRTPPDKVVSTLVYLGQQVDLEALGNLFDADHARLRDRHEAVVLALRDTADLQQPALLQHLDELRAQGRVQTVQAFWIANAVRVDATPAEIVLLAQRPEVDRIYFNPKVTTITPVGEAPGGEGGVASVPEPGVAAVRAPEVWALGITGNGVLVSTLDTGVEGTHPSLASRWKGLEPGYAGNPDWAWFDPVTNTTFPQAFGDHGTHTMGTVCGGAPGDQIGVAPGAKWIHAAVIDRVSIAQTVSDAILAFQWLIDPDGNPNTFFDVPAVCSNSWGLADFHGYPDCDQTFWTFLDACETAGIVILFSAGNEGLSGLRRPSDRATDAYRTLAVAAVNGNVPSFPIAGFSSQGPTQCTLFGGSAIKPDISAPGVSVRSATLNGTYGFKDGTSMASPHVNGVVALMREANPDLSVEQVKQIIYDTAQDLGAASEDNAYGWGMIDAFDAVQEALATVALTINLPNGTPTFIDPLGGTVIDVVASGQSVDPAPGSGMLHYSTGGPFTAIPMVEGALGVYEAVFPTFDCGTHVTFYFSVQAETGETVVKPPSAPDVTYSADVYSGVAVAFVDNFEANMGWTVSNSPTLTTGQWQRGDPVGGGDRGDPAADADGSGQCYVTHNTDGDFDVDNGSTTLTSPALDATQIENPVLSYSRWYHNSFGSSPFQDIMTVEISDDDGATWSPLETVGPQQDAGGGWIVAEFLLADHVKLTSTIRVRFTASDTDPQSVVEAGVDDVRISALFCEEPACPADVTGDGSVNVQDLVEVVLNPGPCAGCPADVNGDGVVDVQDLVLVVLGWGDCE
jgi:subtilisin family serine protease